MVKKRVLTIFLVCALLLSLGALPGCGATQTGGEEESGANSLRLADMTLTGTVQAVDGQTITLALGGESGGMSMELPTGSDQGQAPTDLPTGGDQSQTPEPPNEEQPTDLPDNAAGDQQGNQGATPPDLPDSATGEQPDQGSPTGGDAQPNQGGQAGTGGDGQGQTPERPTGDSAGGQGSESAALTGTVTLILGDASVLTTAEGTQASLDDISVGDRLTVTLDETGAIAAVVIGAADAGGMEGQTMSSAGDISYTALTELTEDSEIADESYASTGVDENALHILNGATVYLKHIAVSRTSENSTGGDNSSFYGVGAALLVSDGVATIADSEITTDAAGGAGVFAYSTGVAYVKDTTIRTTQSTSGGIHVAGGGTLYAWDLDVETEGGSSAAIRSDRGGGTMVVDGGTYVSNGSGSPAVYCTADIAVNNAVLTANGAEGICIEGKNSLHLFNCDLTANMPDDSQNDCTWSLIVYQSMSGDAEVGSSTLQLVGGSIRSSNGGLIYTTNTSSNILLSGVEIQSAADCDFLLKCTGNANQRGWGQSGSNGAQCVFTAVDQVMAGDIIYDSISTLDCYLQNGTIFTGAVVDDESCAGNGGDGYCNLTLSQDATWIVTGDSTLALLHAAGTIRDGEGQTVTILGGDGTVYVQGTSSYTITVTGYDTEGDCSAAGTAAAFADYAVTYSAQ